MKTPPGLGAGAGWRIEMKGQQKGSENEGEERRAKLPPHSWSSGALFFQTCKIMCSDLERALEISFQQLYHEIHI